MANAYRKAFNSNVIEAIRSAGWNVIFLNQVGDSPLEIRVFKDGERYDLRIYGWGISHGGGKRSADEYRIQVQVDQFSISQNFMTLVLGWWKDVEVFAGFDVRKHAGRLGDNPSIQIHRETLQLAATNGIAAHTKDNEEIAVAFRPDFIIEYVRNLENLHNFGKSVRDLRSMQTLIERTNDDEDFQINDADVVGVTAGRRTTVKTVTQKVRESSFKRRVLTAYSFQCSFCSVQLDLIDAAHILPVEHDESTDYTSNGIALCALHHRAFDHALVTFNESYELLVSKDRMKHLESIGHDSGMNDFLGRLRPMIGLPPARTDCPNVTYIQKANTVRGWNPRMSQKIA